MNVEVINTGSELLLGTIVNTHLNYFADQLFPLGLRIGRQVTVPDGEPIRQAFEEAMGRAEIILITGGLGPTTDDLTRDLVAEALGLELHRDPEVVRAMEERFAKRGLQMVERNLRQAEVLEGGVVLPNAFGTAPGIYLHTPAEPRRHVFLLPGPPRELYPMFEGQVLPILRRLSPRKVEHGCRTYHVLGLGESNVEALVGEKLLALPEMELGYCSRPGEVDIRCIAPDATLIQAEKIIMDALGDKVASRNGRLLEQDLIEALAEMGETLVTAESCTGGLVTHRLTNIPGASAVLLAGYITYSNEAKSMDLGVNPFVIETHGAVSPETAAAMAEGALRRSGADWGVATTGIAGPGGGSEEKPVGTLYVAVARRGGGTHVEALRFQRDREAFKQVASNAALDLLRRLMGRGS